MSILTMLMDVPTIQLFLMVEYLKKIKVKLKRLRLKTVSLHVCVNDIVHKYSQNDSTICTTSNNTIFSILT